MKECGECKMERRVEGDRVCVCVCVYNLPCQYQHVCL